MRIQGGTGCGDYLVRGWYHGPTEDNVKKLAAHLFEGRGKAHSSPEFSRAGYLYYGVLHEKRDAKWIAELRRLGFKKASRCVNVVHSYDPDPLVIYTIGTGNVSQRAVKYWAKILGEDLKDYKNRFKL